MQKKKNVVMEKDQMRLSGYYGCGTSSRHDNWEKVLGRLHTTTVCLHSLLCSVLLPETEGSMARLRGCMLRTLRGRRDPESTGSLNPICIQQEQKATM